MAPPRAAAAMGQRLGVLEVANAAAGVAVAVRGFRHYTGLPLDAEIPLRFGLFDEVLLWVRSEGGYQRGTREEQRATSILGPNWPDDAQDRNMWKVVAKAISSRKTCRNGGHG